ncbi:MAG: hypothetical protein ACI86H_001109 [bacterium]|jgi:hypothetical protein
MKLFAKFFILISCSIFLFACESQPKKAVVEFAAPTNYTSKGHTFSYSVPKKWVSEKPSNQMRKGQFRLKGIDGKEDAQLAVFFFPTMGSSIERNLNRWYQQFKQTDGSKTSSKATITKTKTGNMSVTLVKVNGTFLRKASPMMMGGVITDMPKYALIGAIVNTPQGPWFFKAVGPEKTIQHWFPSFEAFATKFQYK